MEGLDTNIWGAVKSMANAVANKVPADTEANLVRKILNRPSNGVVAAGSRAHV
jgi:hypothetical protein